jgi:hypothetical protein
MTNRPYIVDRIVGRCHVGRSNRQVIRYFISRLKRKYRTWAAIAPAERKRWLRWIIEAHAENRELYQAVMTGKF